MACLKYKGTQPEISDEFLRTNNAGPTVFQSVPLKIVMLVLYPKNTTKALVYQSHPSDHLK